MLLLLLLYPMMSIFWTVAKGSRILGRMSPRSVGLSRRLSHKRIWGSSASFSSISLPPQTLLPGTMNDKRATFRLLDESDTDKPTPENPKDDFITKSCQMQHLGITFVRALRPENTGSNVVVSGKLDLKSNQIKCDKNFGMNAYQVLNPQNNASSGLSHPYNISQRFAFSFTVIPGKFLFTIGLPSAQLLHVSGSQRDEPLESFEWGVGRGVLAMGRGDTVVITYGQTKKNRVDPDHLRETMLSNGLAMKYTTKESEIGNPSEILKEIVSNYMRDSELPLMLLFYNYN